MKDEGHAKAPSRSAGTARWRTDTASAAGETALRRPGLLLLVALALAVPTTAAASPASVARQYVHAANRGDFRTACSFFSRRTMKITNRQCRDLFEWGVVCFGPFDYETVSSHRMRGGDWWFTLRRWQHPSYIRLHRDAVGWRISSGGW